MGCDIHMMVEVKMHVNDVEKWVNFDHFRKNPYFGVFDDESEYERVDLCSNRNYAAFSQLCGVRAYSEESPKIADPRGMPSDASDYCADEAKRWDGDAHSHSYATLKEIRDFRASIKPTPIKVMVSPEQAKDFDESGITPKSWCAWTSNDSFVYREWEDVIDALKAIHEAMEARAIERWWHTDNVEPDNIRIVFFFDN